MTTSLTYGEQTQAYVRIASASIGFFDYVMTAPSEYRFWLRQRGRRWPSIGLILFLMCRYFGMLTLIIATVFLFSHFFTQESCERFIYVSSVFRVLLSESAACVLLWRTWAIWGKNRIVFGTLLVILIPVTIISFASVGHQVPHSVNGNCSATSGIGLYLKWPFSAVNLVYDTVACLLSSWRLWHNVQNGNSPISKVLLQDGILYFVVMIIGHTLNLYFFIRGKDLQAMCQLLNVTLMMVFSQRILTSVAERASDSPILIRSYTRSRQPNSTINPLSAIIASSRWNPLRSSGAVRSTLESDSPKTVVTVMQESHSTRTPEERSSQFVVVDPEILADLQAEEREASRRCLTDEKMLGEEI